MSTRVSGLLPFSEEFEPFAKKRYRDIVSTCSSASDCV